MRSERNAPRVLSEDKKQFIHESDANKNCFVNRSQAAEMLGINNPSSDRLDRFNRFVLYDQEWLSINDIWLVRRDENEVPGMCRTVRCTESQMPGSEWYLCELHHRRAERTGRRVD